MKIYNSIRKLVTGKEYVGKSEKRPESIDQNREQESGGLERLDKKKKESIGKSTVIEKPGIKKKKKKFPVLLVVGGIAVVAAAILLSSKKNLLESDEIHIFAQAENAKYEVYFDGSLKLKLDEYSPAQIRIRNLQPYTEFTITIKCIEPGVLAYLQVQSYLYNGEDFVDGVCYIEENAISMTKGEERDFIIKTNRKNQCK